MKVRDIEPPGKARSPSSADSASRSERPTKQPVSPRQLKQQQQIAQLKAAAKPVPVNNDRALEREADRMGALAMQRGQGASSTSSRHSAPEAHGGLPPTLRHGIESLSGMDMSAVRVHRDSEKPAQLNAQAYAQGNDIHLGPGQDRHLPHEAWHIVQQAQGRVRATMQMKARGAEVDRVVKPAAIPSDEYAAAFRALQSQVARATDIAAGPPAQLVLTGEYAEAGLIIIGYSRDSYNSTWESRLQEAQDAGYAAPKLTGHLSQSSGKDDKGEKDRQKQNNKRLKAWWDAYQKWKATRKDDEDDDDSASGAASTSSGKRTESRREEYREQRRTEKREQYRESQKEAPYVAPWHGGPPAWIPHRTD